jgi:dipeptidyl aminopeptidase/acylaminoacyl peptidase
MSDKSGSPELWLWSTSAGRELQLTNLGARINAFTWSPDGHRIAFSALLYGQFDIWTVSVPGGEVKRLTTDARYEIYPSWTPDSRQILYIRPDDRWAAHDVMIMGANGENPKVLAHDDDLFDYGTLGTRSTFGYALVSPDGSSVLFRSHRSGWINYWAVPLAGGAPKQLVPEESDQTDARWSPDGKWVAYVSNHNGTRDVRVVASNGGKGRVVVPVQLGIAAAPDWSPDGKRIAYTLATPTRPTDLFVTNVDGTGTPRQLTTSKTSVAESELLSPEKISYKSDQFTISAYVYKPPSMRPGDKFPGILYIHGGPTGQFSDNFALQPQFLARMGYVVLMPNIRGSSGYGKVFEDANNPCWTHCDLRDVVAGVEYLKTLTYVNAAKMGITGSSYGGIMTMGAVAHAPDVFQAAMPQSGYGNWISFQDYNAELQHTKLLAYEWGPYPDSAAVYRRNSSIFSVKNIKAPVFLVHGEGKETSWRPGVVPIIASKEFALALEKEYKVVLYKTYPGETYYITGKENNRQLLLDMLDFFDRYLKDQGSVPATRTTLKGQ